MATAGIDNVDYIRAFMTERPVVFERSALVIVDMQNASGSRTGALGRRMKAEGSTSTDYRFDRIETLVLRGRINEARRLSARPTSPR